MSGCGCELDETAAFERVILWSLLAINIVMFIVEAVAGWWGESTGLLADALDMLADALVYGIALYAVGRSVRLQANAATTSGILQIALAAGVLFEVVRRILYGSEPSGSSLAFPLFMPDTFPTFPFPMADRAFPIS